jgi:[ribosomal protein S18]-alanine N-acetyltransferase
MNNCIKFTITQEPSGYQKISLLKEKKIIGYSTLSVVVDEAEIIDLEITTAYRRQGFGCLLLQELIRVAKQQGAQKIFLEVRRSNQAAINLYQKMGFKIINIRKNYYSAQDGREDALVLCCEPLFLQ